MFGKKTAPKPDAALLARVSDSSEVDLGTYPEDALAVTGAYPARGSLDPRPMGRRRSAASTVTHARPPCRPRSTGWSRTGR